MERPSPSETTPMHTGADPDLDVLVSHQADLLMTDVLFKLRVNQLVSTLRSQPLTRDDETMLGSLEMLVLAGEITFPGFMLRVQNLFPDVFDRIEPSLRETLMRMLSD
jgi:hypothetical protein